jgi:hypothetical protein
MRAVGYGVNTTRVPDGSAAVQTCATSASGRASVLRCSWPAATMSNIRGRAAEAHRHLHEEMAQGMADFLKRYGNAELEVLAKVLRDLLAAKKTGVRIDVS